MRIGRRLVLALVGVSGLSVVGLGVAMTRNAPYRFLGGRSPVDSGFQVEMGGSAGGSAYRAYCWGGLASAVIESADVELRGLGYRREGSCSVGAQWMKGDFYVWVYPGRITGRPATEKYVSDPRSTFVVVGRYVPDGPEAWVRRFLDGR